MPRLTHALVRAPGDELVDALSTSSGPLPNPARAREQHAAYVAALEGAGLTVEVLPPIPELPDGCFPEDTHLVLPEVVLRLRPAAPGRADEPPTLRPHLPADRPYEEIPEEVRIEGGDVLVDGERIWVGLSARTESRALDWLAWFIEPLGYAVISVPLPPGALHLKSGVTALGQELMVTTPTFARAWPVRRLGTLVELPEDEVRGANLLVVNERVLIAAGCPTLRHEVARHLPEHEVVELDLSEFHRVDGRITCLSLVWSAG